MILYALKTYCRIYWSLVDINQASREKPVNLLTIKDKAIGKAIFSGVIKTDQLLRFQVFKVT